MLEPGELPLMRELPAFKKKQALIDPFPLPSPKSPLLRASPSSVNPTNSLHTLHGKAWQDYCNDFHRAPAAHSALNKPKADMRLTSWDMSNDALFELDSKHDESSQNQNIIEHFDRWREHRDWEYVSGEASPTTSNSSDLGGGEEAQGYPASIFQANADRGPPAKSSQRILRRDHSSRHSVSTLSPKTVHQMELMYNQHSWRAGRLETDSRPNWPVSTSFATKRAAKMNPKHTFVSAAQLLRQSQAPVEPELMESKLHSLELPESMTVKSQVMTTGQRKPRLANGSNASTRKSAQQPPRSQKSSGLEKGPSTKRCDWSGRLHDDSESDVSTRASVDEHGCGRLSQNESCKDSKLRRCKQPSSTIAEANYLQLAVPDRKDLIVKEDKPRSLSQKYRPRVFGELVGQHIVVQSLSNAILKGKIVPVYLFQGPRGTGKTSAARIFAAALICLAPQDQRPCGHCNECASVRSGKNSHVKEVDAASHNGITKVKVLLEDVILASASLHYKVFIIDECHVLTMETWNALLKILEEPPMNVVFILITTDPDQLPRTAASRCQKFPFPKIKDAEIIKRLMNLTSHECLRLNLEVLKLIASRSDGSLRDAEMILDQLSLLGKEIDSSTVHELVGSASDGRILSLLDSALLADTVNTIKRARELVDSGVQPLSLMSHMATLIIDILAGSYQFTEEQRRGFFRRQTLSEDKLERLRKAVKTLSEAEKQLRVSTDKMTWLTAALLQLGPDQSCMLPMSCSGTSITQSPNTLVDVEHAVTDIEHVSVAQRRYQGDASVSVNSHTSTKRGPLADEQVNDRPLIQSDVVVELSRNGEHVRSNPVSSNPSSDKTTRSFLFTPGDIDEIWFRVVQICHPSRLKRSLHGHGKLVSISLSEVNAVVHLEFFHPKHKTRCERSWKNISSVFEEVLGCPVEVKFSLVSQYRIQQRGSASCDLSEQGFPEDFMSKETTYGPDYAVTTHSNGDLVNNFLPKDGQQFSAISQGPSGYTSKDIQCLRARSPASNVNKSMQVSHGDFKGERSNWRIHNAISCMATKDRTIEEQLLSTEEQLDKAWICDAERYSSSSDAVHMSYREVINQSGSCEDRGALPDMLPTKLRFMQEPQYLNPHGWARENAREIVELDVLSLGSHTFGLRDDPEEETQTSLEKCPGPGSTSSEKKKGNTLKVMQRLAIRSRNRSLTENYQNSVEERESPACTVSELQRNSQSSYDTRFSVDVPEHSTRGGSRILSAPPLKNKLRGAAGNVARFFQGKLLRNSQDTFAQCI